MVADHPTDRDTFGHWLSGFVDGEGMFLLKWHTCRDYQIPVAGFEIHLRLDDRSILEEIRDFLGVGTFYDRPERIHGPEKTRSKPQLCYRVNITKHLAKVVVPNFERYPLRAKKRNDFAIWKQGVALLYRVWKRPMQSAGYRKGTTRRWSVAQLDEFESLMMALREQRKFEASTPVIPPSVPTNGDQLRLWGD